MENSDPLPSKPTALGEFAERFSAWVDNARLEEKTKKSYRKRLAAPEDDTCVGCASRPDYGRLRRALEISWLGCKCQLCLADTAPNATQSGGVEDHRPMLPKSK
jgi:hypothetical protein